MKTTLLVCLVCLLGVATYGQTYQVKITKDKNGVINYIKFPPNSSENSRITIPETASNFFIDYLNITNSDEFVKKPQQQRDQRYIHEHFDQFYKGLKVEGGGYNFHFRDGKMYLAHGNYVKINGLNINPSISAEKAADLFADYKSIPRDSVNGFLNELSIKEIPSTAKEDAKTDSKLVYQIRILAADVHNDETGYVKGENEIPL